jgi:hypothetical protein
LPGGHSGECEVKSSAGKWAFISPRPRRIGSQNAVR